jgi:hypothetical protein
MAVGFSVGRVKRLNGERRGGKSTVHGPIRSGFLPFLVILFGRRPDPEVAPMLPNSPVRLGPIPSTPRPTSGKSVAKRVVARVAEFGAHHHQKLGWLQPLHPTNSAQGASGLATGLTSKRAELIRRRRQGGFYLRTLHTTFHAKFWDRGR